MIAFREVTFAYPRHPPVFSEFSWQAEVGERWAVLGPSGCGKTTLLYLIAGLRLPSAGEVTVAGEPVRQPGRETSLVLQDHGLLPWSTALENAALGLLVRGVPRRLALARASSVLDRLGVVGLERRFPSQLSGGQRQRVAIARALATDPSVLLMDEPFASLDALTREDLHDLLQDIAGDVSHALTTVIVTHDIAEAVLLATRMLVLGPGMPRDGRILSNPLGGTRGFRDTAEYAEACRAVRTVVAAARGARADAARQEVPAR